jgi:hypothetical protein
LRHAAIGIIHHVSAFAGVQPVEHGRFPFDPAILLLEFPALDGRFAYRVEDPVELYRIADAEKQVKHLVVRCEIARNHNEKCPDRR